MSAMVVTGDDVVVEVNHDAYKFITERMKAELALHVGQITYTCLIRLKAGSES